MTSSSIFSTHQCAVQRIVITFRPLCIIACIMHAKSFTFSGVESTEGTGNELRAIEGRHDVLIRRIFRRTLPSVVHVQGNDNGCQWHCVFVLVVLGLETFARQLLATVRQRAHLRHSRHQLFERWVLAFRRSSTYQ